MSSPTPRWQRAASVAALVVMSPIFAVAGVAVRIFDGRPVMYRAVRVGRNETQFVMYKFRTMSIDSDVSSAITSGHDARVTRVGRLLRRYKVDELPQLLNVVRGEMALVGPRPEDPKIVACSYKAWMRETLTVPPGIVGPGSLGYFEEESTIPLSYVDVEEYYAEVMLPQKLARDLVYVRDRSVRYDLDLIVRTLLSIVGLSRVRSGRTKVEHAAALLLLRSIAEGELDQ